MGCTLVMKDSVFKTIRRSLCRPPKTTDNPAYEINFALASMPGRQREPPAAMLVLNARRGGPKAFLIENNITLTTEEADNRLKIRCSTPKYKKVYHFKELADRDRFVE